MWLGQLALLTHCPAAHEITHAFDDSGINYDAEGRAAQLYDNSTILGFHREAACLRDQYSTYQLAEAKVDGNLTLGENLADHGGLSMALEGYSAWRRENTDVRLPALPFDDLQLFFIGKKIIGSLEVAVSLVETLPMCLRYCAGYALPWCSRHTAAHTARQVRSDEHAPERFRVLGPLSNSPAFSQAFSCPAGSQMNPVEKCKVW